jgi:macrolide transport system ATP-binding/permease protein
MNAFFRKIGWLFKRRLKEAELHEEIQFHLDEEAEEREASGLQADEAQRAARRDLGNVARVQEDTRAAWGWTGCEQLLQDLRYACRMMAGNKTFTALAILSLALGIGANTAIFSFMDSILLRSLPVSDPKSLVLLEWHTDKRIMHGSNRHDDSYNDPNGGFVGGFFSYPAFEQLHKGEPVFASVFGYQGAGHLHIVAGGQAGLANGEYVSGEYFSGLGVSPFAGRLLAPDDDQAGAAPVAIVSHALSERQFGGPGGAVGRSVRINNVPFTIVGVSPPEFFGTDPNAVPDVYVPMHTNLLLERSDTRFPIASRYLNPGYDWVVIMARLKPGVTAALAQATLADQFLNWERSVNTDHPAADLPKLRVREGAGGLEGLRRTYSKPLYILQALVGLILTIACANIANLLLARAAARKREMAVRLSIGAGRFRVVRQLLTETVVLAFLGGVLGAGLAIWGIRFLTTLMANGRENVTFRAELNWHVLAVVASLSLLTGVLFGLAPALQSTRVDLMHSLKEIRAESGRARRIGLSRVLMVLQIAMTLLMLVPAGLFVRTLSNLQSIQLGFNREKLLTFNLNAPQAGLKDEEAVEVYNDLQARFAALPGVRGVSMSDVPLIGHGTSMYQIRVGGGPMESVLMLTIGTGFFSNMQIPILLGRDIDEHDRAGAPLVAVVNEAFVKAQLPGKNPLGLRFVVPFICAKCEIGIVGVSANAAYGSLKEPGVPIIYFPFAQPALGPVKEMVYEVRTARNPLGIINAVRDIVHRADSRLALSEVTTQSDLIDRQINQQITFARLCTASALLALTIACVGLYATMSYNVVRRTSEIGIRMALGARRSQVVRMVLREVIVLVSVAMAISVPAAMFATKVIESFLFGLKRNDPLTLSIAVLTLIGAAVLAGYLPARSASRIDPMRALRHE